MGTSFLNISGANIECSHKQSKQMLAHQIHRFSSVSRQMMEIFNVKLSQAIKNKCKPLLDQNDDEVMPVLHHDVVLGDANIPFDFSCDDD